MEAKLHLTIYHREQARPQHDRRPRETTTKSTHLEAEFVRADRKDETGSPERTQTLNLSDEQTALTPRAKFQQQPQVPLQTILTEETHNPEQRTEEIPRQRVRIQRIEKPHRNRQQQIFHGGSLGQDVLKALTPILVKTKRYSTELNLLTKFKNYHKDLLNYCIR